MKKSFKKQKTLKDMFDEVYSEIPAYELTEEDVDAQYRRYEEIMKDNEKFSLDLDFDLE